MMWFLNPITSIKNELLFFNSVWSCQLLQINMFIKDISMEWTSGPSWCWNPGLAFFEQDLLENILITVRWVRVNPATLHFISILSVLLYFLLLFTLSTVFII